MVKVVIALALVVVAIGCARSPLAKFEGTWASDASAGGGQRMELTVRADGTFDAKSEGRGDAEIAKGKAAATEKELTLTLTELNGKPPNEADAKPVVCMLSEDGKSLACPNNVRHVRN